MEIVDFKTFVRLPAGTIFAPYTPCCLTGEIEIKIDKGRPYFSPYVPERHIFNGTMTLSPWIGNSDHYPLFGPGDKAPASFEVYDGSNVDYKDHKMFLIFDEKDIDRLIEVLKWAKNGCKGDNPGEYRGDEEC